MAQKQDDADWLRLQRKIFSRWVQQVNFFQSFFFEVNDGTFRK